MSVATKFQNFCINIRIPQNIVDNISYRYKRITKQLNLDFWGSDSDTYHSLYVGSYGRDTEIYISDIDMLFILQPNLYERYNNYSGNGQSALLQDIRNSLQKTYPTTYISADGQVVKIDFADNIGFEIVPCFLNTNGNYTYPDTNNGGSWKATNPKPEIEAIREGNQKWNGNLKNLCRMAREWKIEWKAPMNGFLIDTLVFNFLKNWKYNCNSYSFYDWLTRDFFYFLKNQDQNQSYWLALGSNQIIFRKGIFEYKALQCYNLTIEAIKLENEKYEFTANQKWKEIYGPKFLN